MLALQTAWLLWSGPTLESRLKTNLGSNRDEESEGNNKDKVKKREKKSTQVRSRIWLAVSEAAFKPEAFLVPEFRHLFKVHLTAFFIIDT